jgi:hypothetical protein
VVCVHMQRGIAGCVRRARPWKRWAWRVSSPRIIGAANDECDAVENCALDMITVGNCALDMITVGNCALDMITARHALHLHFFLSGLFQRAATSQRSGGRRSHGWSAQVLLALREHAGGNRQLVAGAGGANKPAHHPL